MTSAVVVDGVCVGWIRRDTHSGYLNGWDGETFVETTFASRGVYCDEPTVPHVSEEEAVTWLTTVKT